MLLHQMRPRQAAWFARDEVGLDAGLRRRNPGGCLCLEQSWPEQEGTAMILIVDDAPVQLRAIVATAFRLRFGIAPREYRKRNGYDETNASSRGVAPSHDR